MNRVVSAGRDGARQLSAFQEMQKLLGPKGGLGAIIVPENTNHFNVYYMLSTFGPTNARRTPGNESGGCLGLEGERLRPLYNHPTNI